MHPSLSPPLSSLFLLQLLSALMHALSVLLGFATIVIPRWITFYLGALLFAIFGAKMLWEGWHMSTEEEKEEFDEVSEELKRKDQVCVCVCGVCSSHISLCQGRIGHSGTSHIRCSAVTPPPTPPPRRVSCLQQMLQRRENWCHKPL